MQRAAPTTGRLVAKIFTAHVDNVVVPVEIMAEIMQQQEDIFESVKKRGMMMMGLTRICTVIEEDGGQTSGRAECREAGVHALAAGFPANDCSQSSLGSTTLTLLFRALS